MTATTIRFARIIRDHYGLPRPVTAAEVAAEIESLRYHAARGLLDDRSGLLAARVENAGVTIKHGTRL